MKRYTLQQILIVAFFTLLVSVSTNTQAMEQDEHSIFSAIKNGNYEMVKSMLEEGVDPNTRQDTLTEMTPLHWSLSCIDNHSQKTDFIEKSEAYIKIIAALLKAGADPNLTTKNYIDTPLHTLALATLSSDVGISQNVATKIFHLLLQYGADVTAQDKNGCTFVHLIVKNKNILRMAAFLVSYKQLVDNLLAAPIEKIYQALSSKKYKQSLYKTALYLLCCRKFRKTNRTIFGELPKPLLIILIKDLMIRANGVVNTQKMKELFTIKDNNNDTVLTIKTHKQFKLLLETCEKTNNLLCEIIFKTTDLNTIYQYTDDGTFIPDVAYNHQFYSQAIQKIDQEADSEEKRIIFEDLKDRMPNILHYHAGHVPESILDLEIKPFFETINRGNDEILKQEVKAFCTQYNIFQNDPIFNNYNLQLEPLEPLTREEDAEEGNNDDADNNDNDNDRIDD